MKEIIVSRQEFIRYTSKYLKDMPVVITRRGAPDLKLDVYKPDYTIEAPKYKINESQTDVYLVYGCGCKQEDGKKLCKKHGRS